jgi:hypothetical protein
LLDDPTHLVKRAADYMPFASQEELISRVERSFLNFVDKKKQGDY